MALQEDKCWICAESLSSHRGILECGHECCLECLCEELQPTYKNRCPSCQRKTKRVVELLPPVSPAPTVSPAHVRFCNVTYIFERGSLFIQDAPNQLSKLFKLRQARLIYRGKILHKGDSWPRDGVVQLFGTQVRSPPPQDWSLSSLKSNAFSMMTKFRENYYVHAMIFLLCFPFYLLYDFFASLFGYGRYHPSQQLSQPRRGYNAIPNTSNTSNQPARFRAPGRVPSPRQTDST